jgi:hypothetical protein
MEAQSPSPTIKKKESFFFKLKYFGKTLKKMWGKCTEL